MSDNDTARPSSAPEPSPPAASNAVGEAVDLSVLKSLSFGPDWSSTPSAATLARKMGGRDEGKPGGGRSRDFGGFENGGAARRDRRPARPPAAFAPAHAPATENGGSPSAPPSQMGDASRAPYRGPGGQRPPRREGFGRDERRFSPPPFRPTHEVLFYPDDAAFRALLKAIRTSCRTYELFEVARLILQKPERFVLVIKPLPREDGQPAFIYISQPDLLPFDTEEEAVGHVFEKHLDKFCDIEEVEVEPPKGNFIGVSRCGFTGELLGPPNYHRYQQLLREHHSRRLARIPFDKFTARVELVKEPEHLAAWLEKMKKITRYKLKTPIEGAPEYFESIDAARQFLLGKSKDAIVHALDTGRYSGRSLEQFPPGNIRHSVEALLALQRRFPLDTANNLRGRLRRMKFNLYKKGSKGVSYICAVKRRFRDPQTVLADHVQKLISFIEQHPLTPASRLPHEFLGLPLPAEKKAAEPAATSAEKPTESIEPAAGDAANGVAPSAAPVESSATTEAPATPPAENAAAEPETRTPKSETLFTPEQAQQFRELVINLRWLVAEGYVVEYGDGRLFAPPPLPAPKAKAANEGVVPAEAEAPAASAEEEIIEDTSSSPFASTPEEESGALGDEAEGGEFSDVFDTPTAAEPAAESAPPPTEPPAGAP
jgi:hypothetical protein